MYLWLFYSQCQQRPNVHGCKCDILTYNVVFSFTCQNKTFSISGCTMNNKPYRFIIKWQLYANTPCILRVPEDCWRGHITKLKLQTYEAACSCSQKTRKTCNAFFDLCYMCIYCQKLCLVIFYYQKLCLVIFYCQKLCLVIFYCQYEVKNGCTPFRICIGLISPYFLSSYLVVSNFNFYEALNATIT